MAPDRLRRAGVVGRQVFRALAGGDHGEARGAQGVHHLADQGGLVAIGHGIDHARRACPRRQQRPGENVRLHVHHDDGPALRDGGQRVADAGGGHAGGLDDHLDARIGDERQGVLGQPGAAVAQRGVEARRGAPFGRPADARQRLPRAGDREVGDAGHLQPRRPRRMGEEHGAELAGADQADGDGPTLGGAGAEQAVQVHGAGSRGMSPPGLARLDAPGEGPEPAARNGRIGAACASPSSGSAPWAWAPP